MNRQKRKHIMAPAMKYEALEIYAALLKKTPGRLQQNAGHKNPTQKNISVYEYLAIPTFIRLGKTIDAGY